VIRTEGLTKRYGKLTVVDDVGLDVREGDRYGFLGPNGSGKSTTVRMLLGLVSPTTGTVRVLDEQMPRRAMSVLPRVGALIESPAFWPHLSGRRNLAVNDAAGPGGRDRGRRERIEAALARVALDGVDDRPVKAYSLGMKQRLGLAGALLHRPTLLVLDEPTNGLDPQGIREIRDLLVELNEGGTTVFLSSHLLGEVESFCTKVGIVSNGRLVAQDAVAALRRPTGRVVVSTPDVDRAREILGRTVDAVTRGAQNGQGGQSGSNGQSGQGGQNGQSWSNGQVGPGGRGGQLLVRTGDPAALNALLTGHGIRVGELTVERRTLEDAFLELTESSVFS